MAPIIPVLTVDRVEDSVPIAAALVAGGLPVIEVTLRTPAALDAIVAMRTVEGAIVGAGTVLTPGQYDEAADAGAEFIISPGLTAELADAAGDDGRAPLLPGVATASEVMRALDRGFTILKYFPAASLGGPTSLAALSQVFRTARFCPTGGIRPESAAEWLAIESVLCVGGSWLVPAGAPIDPSAIEERARQAAQLRPSRS